MARKAVVMAGGEGTRLRPLTDDVPKPFLPVAGKPAIEYGLDALVAAGIRDVVVTTYYKPERLLARLQGGTRLGCRLFYSVEDEALGTAGGVAKARSWLDGTFVVMSGDVLADVDVKELVRVHEKSGAAVTMALTEVEDPTQFGVVATDAAGRVTRFQEKPKTREEAFSNLVNAGIYVVDPRVLERVPEGRPFDWSRDVFPRLLADGETIRGERLAGVWMDVGRPADLLRAHHVMGERRHGGAYIHPGARVDAAARVASTHAYAGARVAAGARVTNCVLYEGAVVEAGATLEGCILGAGAVVEADSSLVDGVLGAGARAPAGARLTGARLSRPTGGDVGL